MDNRQLIIDGVEVPLSEGEKIPINRSIVDIAEPWNRVSDHSKEFLLPCSKEANKVFNYIFDINTASTFNPNLKLDAQYIEGGETLIDGYVRMLDIIETDDQEKFYQIQLIGSTANIFREFGQKEIDDSTMNWGELDHNYTQAIQTNSWATSYILNGVPTAFQYGVGFMYGIINYGRHPNPLAYHVEDLFPSTPAREILLRMFTAAGYTWNSTFLDGAYFRRLYIPMNTASELGLASSAIDNRRVESDTPNFGAFGTSVTAPNSVGSFPWVHDSSTLIVPYTNETVDPLNAYDPSTGPTGGIWTAPANGWFNFTADADFTATFLPTGAANPCYCNGTVIVELFITVNGTPVNGSTMWITSSIDVPVLGRTTTGTSYPDNDYNSQQNDIDISAGPSTGYYPRTNSTPKTLSVNVSNYYVYAGDEVRVHAKYVFHRIDPYDGASVAWDSLDAGEGIFVDTTSTTTSYDGVITLNMTAGDLVISVANAQVSEGDTVDYQSVIPKKVKQRDFFKGIINMHNLFISPDPDNPKILNIEPRNDYYNNDIDDISELWAKDKPMNSKPMGALDGVEYLYTYKKDKDFYNDDYQTKYQEQVGTREFEITNDFETATAKTEVLFSASPSVGMDWTNFIVPWITKKDNQGNTTPIETNIRILYYGGLKNTNDAWNHRTGTTNTWKTTYPFLGMWNDAYNPTISIEFGLSRKIYYNDNFGAITATNNNLFNEYYRQYIEEVIDPDSKLVTAWFALTPYKMRTMDFRNLFYWNNAYYRLNRIINYKENRLTQCEFLKLNYADPFSPSTILLKGDKNATLDGEKVMIFDTPVQEGTNYYNPKNGTINGENNIVAHTSKNFIINGDGNSIGGNTKNIVITGGDNNVIDAEMENVTLINTSNETVLTSNTTYINGVALSGSKVIEQENSNFTTKIKTTTYEVDTSAGDVTVTLETDGLYEGKIWRFKKTSAANNMIITSKANNYTVEGSNSITVSKLNTEIPLQYDGDTNFIIL